MNKPPHSIPPQSEFGQMRSYLARMGMSQQQISQAVGIAPNGRTRAQISEQFINWRINTGQNNGKK